MTLAATSVWHLHPSGSANNGAGFDPGATNMAGTDLAATSANGNSPVVTSATYNFVSGDVGHFVFIKSGTNWVPGWYEIASVAANAATLKAATGEARLYDTTNHAFPLNTTAGCATTASPTSGTWSIDYSRKSDGTSTLSATDWSCLVADDAGRLIIRSATATVSVAMIANFVRVHAGSGWVTGYYLITATTGAGLLTLERSPANGADRTSGSAIVGGSANLPSRILRVGNATGDKVVAGNRVYIRGSGTDSPTSTDYLDTNYIDPVLGTSSNMVRLIGYNGKPRWENTQGLTIYNPADDFYDVQNIYFFLRSAATYQGLIELASSHIYNCTFDLNEVNSGSVCYSTVGLRQSEFRNNLVFSQDAAASSATNQVGIYIPTYGMVCYGNTFQFIGGRGLVNASAGTAIFNVCRNIIRYCNGIGIDVVTGTSTSYGGQIHNNVIDNCGGDGIYLNGVTYINAYAVHHNIITNCTGSGKFALKTSGTTSAVDAVKGLIDYNAFYNNASNFSGISQGPHDVILTADPYTNAAGGDYTLNNTAGGGAACRDAGFPQVFPGLASTDAYTPIGILATPSGGSGGVVVPTALLGLESVRIGA